MAGSYNVWYKVGWTCMFLQVLLILPEEQNLFLSTLVRWCGLVRFSSTDTCFIHCALLPEAQVLFITHSADWSTFSYKGMYCAKCWHQGHLQTMFEEGVKWDETLASSRECMPHCWPWCELKRQGLPLTGFPQWHGTQAGILRHPLTSWDLGTKTV